MGVKVKALEWRDTVGVQTACTIIGIYAVLKPESEWQLRFMGKVLSRHPDEETAKSAAKAHYEPFILSSIEQE